MNDADFLLFTDGSGYQDGFGGWACLAKTRFQERRLLRVGCASGTSVDRMEMTAMVEGMQMIIDFLNENPNALRRLDGTASVTWYSDRESMVKSALGEYDRSNEPDLWHRYVGFQTRLRIEPVFIKRETDFPEFQEVDLHASTGRIIIKNYFEGVINGEPGKLLGFNQKNPSA
jgi:ribonuclease HI